MKNTFNFTKPNNSSPEWDLRDVIPIFLSTALTEHQIYKIGDAGIDLKEKRNDIIKLAQEGLSIKDIVAQLGLKK